MAPMICAGILPLRPSFLTPACIAKAEPAIAPMVSSPRCCPFHNSAAMLTTASTPMAAITFSTNARSSLVCALIGEVPSQLSTGVRSQKSDIAATMNSASAPPFTLERRDATAPVASGTSSMPHAPCSRGMTSVFTRRLFKVVVCAAMFESTQRTADPL